MSSRIEDYALIGDGETAALVGRDGSVDWLCWPRFDSPACFAALVGEREHGRWRIAPVDESARSRRGYRGDTLILETEHSTPDGSVTVIDFMPPRSSNSNLVRIVEGTRGRVAMDMELVLRFGYGASRPWLTRTENGAVRAISGPDLVALYGDVETRHENGVASSRFSVAAGERRSFVLTYGPSHRQLPQPPQPGELLRDTDQHWRAWAGRCNYHGEHRDAVMRSLLTLKALIHAPTGGIVAAPTTSLPEQLGGTRNWDYRFCWLRDATFTLLALMDAGYSDEAAAWSDWLLRAAAGSPAELQIMYGVAGERQLWEREIPWLSGYEGARPVRIGNAAHSQLQLDVFGEVLDALHHATVGGMAASEEGWRLQVALVEHLQTIWREPDHGMWEVRGPKQHFTHSKIMAWVAVDRAIKTARMFGNHAQADEWRALRAEIHAEVCSKGYDADRGSFVQAYGSRQLDASLLMMTPVGFLPAADARVRGTIAAIERELVVGGLVQRYDTTATDDGLPPGEGAFLPCSFWLADNLALLGRTEEARVMFDRLLRLANDVGLLAEEYDPRVCRQVGNFPQAFSHVSLIDTAFNLSHVAKPAEERAATGLAADDARIERRSAPR
jgi:GH15 family glucan-1,4-alpha-glucosidase